MQTRIVSHTFKEERRGGEGWTCKEQISGLICWWDGCYILAVGDPSVRGWLLNPAEINKPILNRWIRQKKMQIERRAGARDAEGRGQGESWGTRDRSLYALTIKSMDAVWQWYQMQNPFNSSETGNKTDSCTVYFKENQVLFLLLGTVTWSACVRTDGWLESLVLNHCHKLVSFVGPTPQHLYFSLPFPLPVNLADNHPLLKKKVVPMYQLLRSFSGKASVTIAMVTATQRVTSQVGKVPR